MLTSFLTLILMTATPDPINSFESPADIAAAQARGTRISATREHATEGKQALRVEFLPGEWPNVYFAAASPWDWRGTGGLALDLTNPGKEPVEFNVRVDDDLAADGTAHCRTGSARIEPGATATFLLPIARDPMSLGMRGLPPMPGVRSLGANGNGSFNPGHIVAFQVFMHAPAAATTLILDNVRTVPAISMEGIVDRFGQYPKAEWPGKLHSEADLKQRQAAEAADLKAHPAPPDRDRFGGWDSGPKLKPTGFFRTEKRDGKWWLVDPDGHLFFSIGIDCVNTDLATFVTGREKMFSWLPKRDEPLARFYQQVSDIHSRPVKSGEAFDFFRANLQRKYGAGYERAWFDLALERLRSWGFNTIGNWSDPALYHNGRVPYVATVDIAGTHARVSSGEDYWGKMHEPFDPQFARDAAESLRPVARQVKGDPCCIGYFVDNELSWGGWGDDAGRYGLALGALSTDATSPAKQAFASQLRAKYGELGRLNSAWGTNFPAWEALGRPGEALTAAAKEDMGAFVKSLARKYFTVVRDALKAADPNHLYLGCRFAWRTPEAVAAAVEISDVVSFNIYAPRVDPATWRFTESLNKPCIIGEFHFGALDRGMFHPGLVATASQQERARTYVDYLHSVLDNPAFVGCHWFQYVDEPLTGRVWDGENYNIGFLTVTDTPYPEMVAAARQVRADAYRRRGR